MNDARIPYTRPMRLAVLIDAENASSKVADGLFAEIASLGEASARRIYGDAASPALRNWVSILPQWALQWQQNFQNTKGKNSGDIALVIDAMDLMHSGRFDGFCLVSSDSDFTRLAARIREQGYPVYGFGEQKTPESFRQACTRFIYLENLMEPLEGAETEPAPSADKPARRPLKAAEDLIIKVMHDADDDGDGWVALGLIGNRMRNAYPDFDHRSYGFAKLSSLIKASKRFEVVQSAGNGLNVRLK
ncbi:MULTISPECIES: NYN domain-containing protein [Brevundimonas]|uniref:NYN domain-containing protein n=1 Tax=Brevundimonas pishanensis TaxID=2896315 RepID=UPI001FA7D0D8|nr:NYN domain-containing protein [Brevundimonas pishanensis]